MWETSLPQGTKSKVHAYVTLKKGGKRRYLLEGGKTKKCVVAKIASPLPLGILSYESGSYFVGFRFLGEFA